ncbi:hypothetical protein [Paraglaciecola sp.]|uniref:hypothetical protein n=1 Tax=Paraglaciecola sp. TaxID=1920173 RepID=UPI0032662A15
MLEKTSVLNQIQKELQNLTSSEDRTNYLLEKLATIMVSAKQTDKELSQLKSLINKSELFFSLPEVTLLTRSKLPHVLISAGDAVPIGDNFYEPEAIGTGKHIRWTGPDRINTFHVPIDRTEEKTLRLTLHAAIKPEIFSSIKLYIDGKLAKPSIEQRETGVELIISLNSSDRVQDTVISMFIPHLYSPKDIDPASSDGRKLGVAFNQLEIV